MSLTGARRETAHPTTAPPPSWVALTVDGFVRRMAGGFVTKGKVFASVEREVVRALVDARLLLAELHEDVVEQRRRTDAVQIRIEPVRPERLVHEDQVLDRLLRRAH